MAAGALCTGARYTLGRPHGAAYAGHNVEGALMAWAVKHWVELAVLAVAATALAVALNRGQPMPIAGPTKATCEAFARYVAEMNQVIRQARPGPGPALTPRPFQSSAVGEGTVVFLTDERGHIRDCVYYDGGAQIR
jgi:hypothetical protein